MPEFKMPSINDKPIYGVAAYRKDLQERIAHHRKNLERAERLLRMVDENVPVVDFIELTNTPVEE